MKTLLIYNAIEYPLKYSILEGDYSDLNGICINSYDEDENKVKKACSLLYDMEQEIKNAYSLHQRAMEQRQQCWEMVKEIRELFYECSDEEFCIRKSLDEIEESKLVEVLEKYHKLLGFV